MRCCGSYRRWVALCALIQAAAFLPLLLAALTGRMPTTVVFALIAVYWATGLGGNGPWNAWMETLVPSRLRARYFAWRCESASGETRWALLAAESPWKWPTDGERR